MGGLLLLLVVIAWLLVCIWLARQIAGTLQSRLAKALVACGAFICLFVAPVADDILGARQYRHYCAAADEVRILGTIDVSASTGLHSASGDWLLATLEPSQHDERSRLRRLADSLVRWDLGTSTPTASLFAIDERTTRIYDAGSDRLLAEWKSYHYRGGFLRSNLLDSASQCFPSLYGSALYQKIFVLQRS
jgi:hypothetical protein